MAIAGNRATSNTLALGLGALSAFILAALPPARAQAEHATVALPAQVVVFDALYVAQDYFWPKDGLDVKFINIAGIGALNAVISGSAEFSAASSGSITRAAAHGQRLMAIANLQTDNGQLVVLRKDIADAGHFDPKASFAARGQFLKGRTLATGSYGAVSDVVMRLQAKAAGLDSEKDLTITQMQPADAMAAMSRHAIDGFSYAPPWGYIAVQAGTAVVLLDGSSGDPPGYAPLATLLIARPQLCVERRALCEKMGHSMVEATRFLKEHPSEATAALKKRFATFDDAILATAEEAVARMTPSPPLVTEAELANGDRMNSDAGFLKPEDRIKSYDGLFTNEFVE